MVNEGIINKLITLKIIKMIVTDWTKWDAYKLGIIDSEGKRTSKKLETSKEKDSWDFFTRFIAKVKRLFTRFLGKSKLVSIFSLATIFKECENNNIQLNMLNEEEYNTLYEHIENILKEIE